MKRFGKAWVELVVLTTTAAYVFWRWADHASYGGPIGFPLIFNLVIVAVASITGMYLVRRIVPGPPLLVIAGGIALTVCLGYMTSMGADLSRFRALGGPGSKEMQQLAINQHIRPEAVDVFLQAAALRIRREFWFTGLIVILVLAYLSRLSKAAEVSPLDP